jgi:ABC-2 type transport system permease protein
MTALEPDTGIRASGAAAPVLTQTGLFARRTLQRFLRTPASVVGTLAFPLLLLFLQLAEFGRLVHDAGGGSYIDRLAPLIVLATAGFGASVTGVGTFADLRAGLLDRVRAMPLSPAALLGGRVVGDVTRILLVAIVTTAVSFLPGFRFARGPLSALGFFAVVALFGVAWTWAAIAVAFALSTPATVQSTLSLPSTLLVFLSSGFVPVTAFPAGIQPVVRANPLSTADNALIGLSSGGPVLVPFLQTLAWVVAISAVCAAFSLRRYAALTRR